MIDAAEFLWSFSFISLLLRFVHVIRKKGFFSMVLSTASPRTSVSPSSPSSPWTAYGSRVFSSKSKGMMLASLCTPSQESSGSYSCEVKHPCGEGSPRAQKPRLCTRRSDFGKDVLNIEAKRCPTESVFLQDSIQSRQKDQVNLQICPREEYRASICGEDIGAKTRKRPARIVIPEACVANFDEACKDLGERDVHVQGRDFCVASRRGRRRRVMEDGCGVMTDIHGNFKQAFFGVFDGHGGREAVDYVTDELGKNIVRALAEMNEEEEKEPLEKATKVGYQTTDQDFLVQGLRSGACAATVLIKDGEAQVANVGDCRIVLSRKGVADAVTGDHRIDRQDERTRIESSGGYVNIHNGVWRVQGSLAVSRAIGDSHLKEWVISEPGTQKVRLTPECQFFIVASDGLWDKVSNQEAVDVVLKHKDSIESCKMLVELSCMRGNLDDITVMVVDLRNFVQ